MSNESSELWIPMQSSAGAARSEDGRDDRVMPFVEGALELMSFFDPVSAIESELRDAAVERQRLAARHDAGHGFVCDVGVCDETVL